MMALTGDGPSGVRLLACQQQICTFLYITTCRARSALPSGVPQRARTKEFSLALVSPETEG
jgi:hypothetical protein